MGLAKCRLTRIDRGDVEDEDIVVVRKAGPMKFDVLDIIRVYHFFEIFSYHGIWLKCDDASRWSDLAGGHKGNHSIVGTDINKMVTLAEGFSQQQLQFEIVESPKKIG